MKISRFGDRLHGGRHLLHPRRLGGLSGRHRTTTDPYDYIILNTGQLETASLQSDQLVRVLRLKDKSNNILNSGHLECVLGLKDQLADTQDRKLF